MKKNKTNIEKKTLYLFMVAAIAFVVFTTIHMLWDIAFAKDIAINSGIDKLDTNKLDRFIYALKQKWMFQYISSIILIFTFMLMVLFGVNKTEYGYGFIVIWNAIWIGFLIAPIILYGRFGLFDGLNILLVLSIFVGAFYMHKDIQKFNLLKETQKKFNKY